MPHPPSAAKNDVAFGWVKATCSDVHVDILSGFKRPVCFGGTTRSKYSLRRKNILSNILYNVLNIL